MKVITAYYVEISSNKDTVWIHVSGKGFAETIARFSKKFGIDIHNLNQSFESYESFTQCLYCCHKMKVTRDDWKLFCKKVGELYDLHIPTNLLSFAQS